ncbi:MAG: hypothetical protein ACI8RZ_002279 [Myxococcota bacterium]
MIPAGGQVELKTLERADRRRMSEALRRGEPVDLNLSRPPPPDVRLDEIAPLCRSVRSDNQRLVDELSRGRAPEAQPGSDIQVTAVIPTADVVPIGLAALLGQDVAVRVLVLSNGEGGPRSIPGADVLRVPWRGHGATRQLAIPHITDPYTLLCVNDAIPLGAGFVRTLVEALEAGNFDAVYARQIPWPDADPITRRRLRKWTPAGQEAVNAEQVDHVAALYRTETLRRFPLPDVPIAEDAVWSVGRRIGYVPAAPVLHSHPRSPRALFRRNRAIHTQLVRLGRPATVPSLGHVVGAMPSMIRPTIQGDRGELFNQVAELLGQWRGGVKGRR